jgi:cellulose synthase/poly-beta-1,6-N-acetylglucosamine synthase-like glycosyltransferase
MTDGILYFIWIIIQILIGYNLVLPLLLFFFYKFRQSFYRKKAAVLSSSSDPDYAIIITAYEQTDLLPSVVSSVLNLTYTNYLVYVVADNCDISQLHFNDERVILLNPETTLASNTASHFYAINRFRRDHTHLTIIDSDNLVDKDYLSELNAYFRLGFSAVQGLRKAKNLDTTYASIDAARDIYYHYYDGKLLFGSGSSATLDGSGMAFSIALYRKCLEHLHITGAGFDKVLQYQIVNRGYRIAFAEEAVLYDEKTAYAPQLIKQRSRWINTWFRYFRFGFTLLGKGLRNGNFNQFMFGLTLLRPPLFIFIILSVIFLSINIFYNINVAMAWIIALAIFVAGFTLALTASKTPAKIYKALLNIPIFILLQVISLFRIRTANKVQVASKHIHKNIDVTGITTESK